MISQAILVTIFLMLLATGRYMEAMPMPTCQTSTGNLSIPSPFCITSHSTSKPLLNLGKSGDSRDSYNDSAVSLFGLQNPCQMWLKGDGKKDGWGCSTLADFAIFRRYRRNRSFNCSFDALVHGPEGRRVFDSKIPKYADSEGRKMKSAGFIRYLPVGKACSPHRDHSTTFFYIILALMVPAVGSSWIFWRRKQKKVVKLRRNLFIRNGGEILRAMQSIQKTLSIFTAEDLKKATNNYDENNVICQEQEHLRITYSGILHCVNQSITIKFCNGFDQCNIEVLIIKLVSLSEINHRNVVKLLGCCLETQVPLVVYEFLTSKTLLDYLTDDFLARLLSWDTRLRIAADTAGALTYMHSAAPEPIIHGSLNSSSILLDHAYTVKVDGFALTCSECSCVEAYGYLDPDYRLSGRLTEKSDVYNFGFILAELLTGKDVMRHEWVEGEGNLAKYFVGVFDDRVVTDENVGQMTEVAEIAKRCLSSSSKERPTMKEVATALECILATCHYSYQHCIYDVLI